MACDPATAETRARERAARALREDIRWAYDTEMKRVERADTLAAALIATSVPTGALLATVLKDYDLTPAGEKLIFAVGVLLFLAVLLALWARVAFMPWSGSKLGHRAAQAVAPAGSALEIGKALANSDPDAVDAQLAASWETRLEGAQQVARQKVWIVFGSLVMLALAALTFGIVLAECVE